MHRDLTELPGGRLYLYPAWEAVLPFAKRHLADADVAMVTLYCPEDMVASDLVLSFTGGRALEELKTRLGARYVVPLYGSVDPEAHRPGPAVLAYLADLSYRGTYATDRQAVLLGGALYLGTAGYGRGLARMSVPTSGQEPMLCVASPRKTRCSVRGTSQSGEPA
jgi:hypothetical protein